MSIFGVNQTIPTQTTEYKFDSTDFPNCVPISNLDIGHKMSIHANSYWTGINTTPTNVSQNGVVEAALYRTTVPMMEELAIQRPSLPYLTFSSIASAITLFGIMMSSVVIFSSGLALFATLLAAYWERRR